MATQKEIEDYIKLLISKEINTLVNEIDAEEQFIHFGIDSMKAIAFLDELEKRYKLELNPLLFWDYPSIKALSKYLHLRLSDTKP